MNHVRPISRIVASTSGPQPLKRKLKIHTPIISVKQLHGHLIRTEMHTDPDSMDDVICSYSLTPRHLHKAQIAFNLIDQPTFSLWYHLIRGSSQSKEPIAAFHIYIHMHRRRIPMNNSIFTFAIRACARIPNLALGQQLHSHVLKYGFESYVFVSNALISLYSCCSLMITARKLFDEMYVRDLVSWNTLICGYSQCNEFTEVLALFDALKLTQIPPDAVTMMKVVFACIRLCNWEYADSSVRYIEESKIEIDLYLGNSLIDMYGHRGLSDLAHRVFDQMLERNIVTWNSMIAAHSRVNDLVSARKFFDNMPRRDVISWTSMICAYSHAKQFANSVTLFRDMMTHKVRPDEFTATAVLSACAHLGLLDVGAGVHEYIRKHGVKADLHVGNALIDMYCKCGAVEKSLEAFYDMESRDIISWSSVIMGLAVNGRTNPAVEFFNMMLGQGIRPNHAAFLGILQACVHSGSVEEGLRYFESMERVHGLAPGLKHYGCVVGLLSRAGQLWRAYGFLKRMPIRSDEVLWRILLSGCQLHGDVALAEVVVREMGEVDAYNSADYVLLSNAYAGAGRWKDAIKMREMMDDDFVKKPTGWSSVDVH